MALKRHLPFSAESCCCHEQEYSLKEFMEKLDPSELQQVQQMCQKHQINIVLPSSRKRIYRLQFRNKLPEKLFTTKKLSENNIKVEIVDSANEVIRSGSMATANVEIVVLHGDFDGDENVEWTKEEFKKHLVVPRNNKAPLLVGNLIKLCDGVGCVSDAKFTDNSSWTKTKKFRLGVKVHGGIDMAGEVVEGISNAFRVFDRHMLKCQKDRPLPLHDEVCCLKGISKKGSLHTKLVEKNIKTVWDFLCYCDNQPPDTLRDMLGMGELQWKTTYDHAMQSKISFDTQLYAPLNLPALDQISFQIDESISPMNSLPSNGSQQLPSFAEYEQPISVISTSAQNLPPVNLSIESNNSSKTNLITGVESNKFSEVLIKGNGRSEVPNKFYIDSLPYGYIWLKIYFIVRLKSATKRSQKRRCFETSSPRHNAYERQLEDFSRIHAYENKMDQWFDLGIDNYGLEYANDTDDYNDLWNWQRVGLDL